MRIAMVIAIAGLVLGFVIPALRRRRPSIPSFPFDLPHSATEVDRYLSRCEAAYGNITSGAEKTVVWATGPGEVTELAIVYLHGFSATRQETSPLSEIVAAHFGANIFYTRFTGHGQDGEALGAATASDWLRDGAEAIRIGATIGRRVVVIGTSTGATIAVALAGLVETEEVAAYVLMSPNFGPRTKGAGIALLPGGGRLIRLLAGPRREWTPSNELHARYWTYEYPVEAVVPMMESVRLARRVPLAEVEKPVMVIYSPEDTVVDPSRIERAVECARGADIEVWPITETDSETKHVLAGEILAPRSTERVAERVIAFLDRFLSDVPNSNHR